MTERNTYPSIDMIGTGIHLKNIITQKGYTVKDIQELLNLSCPQPVYRWFKGQILPSVDHLFALSRYLGVHMEELLVPRRGLPAPEGELPLPGEGPPASRAELSRNGRKNRHIRLFKYCMCVQKNRSGTDSRRLPVLRSEQPAGANI